MNIRYKVLFFTGAGISQESGIPTFSEQEGLREKLVRSFALSRPEEFKETIKLMRDKCWAASPNPAHYAIAATGYPIITMNIDGLHQKAGSTDVLEIHGRLPEDSELYADNYNQLIGISILYDDPAPLYAKARQMVNHLEYGNSTFVIVGASNYTAIARELYEERQKLLLLMIMPR